MCVCKLVDVCMCASSSLSTVHLVFWRQGISLACGLPSRWSELAMESLRSSCVHSPALRIKHMPPKPLFSCVTWGLNPGPHGCTASIFLAEPSLQWVPWCMCRGQRTTYGSQFSPFTCEFWGPNSNLQACWQVPSSTESSSYLWGFLINVS